MIRLRGVRPGRGIFWTLDDGLLGAGGGLWTKFRRHDRLTRLGVEPDPLSKRECSATAGIDRAVRFANDVLGSRRGAGRKFFAFADGLRRCGVFPIGPGDRDTDPVSFPAIEIEYEMTRDFLMRRIRIVSGGNGGIVRVGNRAFGGKFRVSWQRHTDCERV